VVPRGPLTDTVVGILNLDIGNLRSVSNAVYEQGWDFRFIEHASALNDVTHLIIPGVGAFERAVKRLDERELREPVRAFAASGRPVLGLCLGMQLLATVGEEGGHNEGLDLIPGRVKRLRPELVPSIPHVGWNSVELLRQHSVTRGVRDGADFYFVHSYAIEPDSPADVLGTTECGQVFTSAVTRGNVVGFQFHPEKSQANGMRLVDNFCGWDGKC
jgi:imidazole glycerol-phosphate synthase subunit HisH